MKQINNLLSIQEASKWASSFLNREISSTNISYLVQYGKIKKYGENGSTKIDLKDLKYYYEAIRNQKKNIWTTKLGDDLNWFLSFDNLREKDTTKHVHRVHPYKGKFIPQLVEYFLDSHIDQFKKQIYFKKGDIVLDPFAGSGTTLVQANELKIHSIGIDISNFNCLISKTKLHSYNVSSLEEDIEKIKSNVTTFETDNNIVNFDNEFSKKLSLFNSKYFPSPQFKYEVNEKKIDENIYGEEKEIEFKSIFDSLIHKYKIVLKQSSSKTFLEKWYLDNVRREIDYTYKVINMITDKKNKDLLTVILSRTIRSCRATTHSDLATLKEPQITTYYCFKHKKICKPLFSIKDMFSRYAKDTLFRIKLFQSIKSNAFWQTMSEDSRMVNIEKILKIANPNFYKIYKNQKIKGIFTSPPYVGQIDYHEQHAYAYDLLGIKRKDELEIGPLYKGQGKKAREMYVEGISKVLLNCKKYLTDDFNIFIVANDKYNLYPTIAKLANMRIVNQFKRPVLNRTERDKAPYSEIIFHIRAN